MSRPFSHGFFVLLFGLSAAASGCEEPIVIHSPEGSKSDAGGDASTTADTGGTADVVVNAGVVPADVVVDAGGSPADVGAEPVDTNEATKDAGPGTQADAEAAADGEETVAAPECSKTTDCAGKDDPKTPCVVHECKDGECVASKTAANNAACDDADKCTKADVCQDGQCNGTAVLCDDNNPCTDDSCVPASGCKFTNTTAKCSDGNECTGPDACKDGKCVAGPTTCACTQDSDCKPTTDKCMGTIMCSAEKTCVVKPGSAVKCVTAGDTECQVNKCNPQTGLCGIQAINDKGACDVDGSKCTKDICEKGACKQGPPTDCDDNNPCTDDSCAAKTGLCVNVGNVSPCDDGDKCTDKDTCKDKSCKAGAPLVCKDGDCCALTCDKNQGCTTKLSGPCILFASNPDLYTSPTADWKIETSCFNCAKKMPPSVQPKSAGAFTCSLLGQKNCLFTIEKAKGTMTHWMSPKSGVKVPSKYPFEVVFHMTTSSQNVNSVGGLIFDWGLLNAENWDNGNSAHVGPRLWDFQSDGGTRGALWLKGAGGKPDQKLKAKLRFAAGQIFRFQFKPDGSWRYKVWLADAAEPAWGKPQPSKFAMPNAGYQWRLVMQAKHVNADSTVQLGGFVLRKLQDFDNGAVSSFFPPQKAVQKP